MDRDMESSSMSPPGAASPGKPLHTRTYQACNACRDRKVKCDLGPVDNPHPPPCKRCRRESKICEFSNSRRKRKTNGDEEDEELADDGRNGTSKRSRLSMSNDTPSTITPVPTYSQPQINVNPGYNHPYPTASYNGGMNALDPQRQGFANSVGKDAEEHAVAILQKQEMFSGSDGINILIDAARLGEDRARAASFNAHSHDSLTAFQHQSRVQSVNGIQYHNSLADGVVDPAIGQSHDTGNILDGVADDMYDTALRAWRRLRFVRSGWFTAKEGIAYVEYFYTYLYPLTPISLPEYNKPDKHVTLLEQEPLLLIVILTISSRYMRLEGPAASTRHSAIHDKLWTYLRGMIERTIWAQEQFGGGLCGAGAESRGVNQLTTQGLRTLGTVEAFMLLTEWHPRALHFPPSNDEDELMVPEDPFKETSDDEPILLLNGTGGQRRDSWLEPCWRSDRMCWMLLGYAITLAFEIGVFDETSQEIFQENNPGIPSAKISAFFERKNYLKDLLPIYIIQLSGRLELIGKLPPNYLSVLNQTNGEQRLQNRLAKFNGTAQVDSPGTSYKDLSPHRVVLHFWEEITGIMKSGNENMFPNRRRTRELIKSGRYRELLTIYQPMLEAWRRDFNECTTIPALMGHILNIEYEYSRVYLNSLALQAVVERCTNATPVQRHVHPNNANNQNGNSSPRADGLAIPPVTLMKRYGEDRKYIDEVIDGCRSVLKIVVEGLLPNEYLKHCPVRTYFRIISVAVILLKTFALGAFEEDVAISLGLMDRAVEALRACIVDDVHIGNRFADMCETLTRRIRSRFIRISTNGGNGSNAGNLSSRAESPGLGGQNSPRMPPPRSLSSVPMTTQSLQFIPSYPTSNHPSEGSPYISAGDRVTPTSALYGIATETYDPGSLNHSVMPPPGYNANGQFDVFPNGINDTYNIGYDSSADRNWLTLPLDSLVSNYGADISSSSYGPDVNGYDLLDTLLGSTDGDPMG